MRCQMLAYLTNPPGRGFLTQGVVAITPEDSDRTYHISKALLCSVSDYFIKALNGRFTEASNQRLRLPGCDDKSFRIFLYWLHHRALPEPFDVQESLVKAWAVGEALLLEDFQAAVLKALRETWQHSVVDMRALAAAFELTAEKSYIQRAVLTEFMQEARPAPKSADLKALETIPGFLKCYMELAIEYLDYEQFRKDLAEERAEEQ
jgi:hypothetical protein